MFHWQDVRYALRLLRRSPFFTLLTVVVLGGGLAVSVFTFSFLHTAMLRPLPLGDGDRIMRVGQEVGSSSIGLDAADLALMRPAITTLSDLGAFTTRELVVGTEGRRRVLDATAVEWNVFHVTRTAPALGRGFLPDDQAIGAEPVIVLGHRTWEVAFGSDSSIVDRTVPLNGTPTRVIGVMPAGYGFPVAAEAWVPLGEAVLSAREPGIQSFSIYARLAAGVSAEAAQAELQTLNQRARQSRPVPPADESAGAARIIVRSFPMAQMGDEGPLMLAVLNTLAALILLLACINVTNLLLARANERARETAVRLALGASRSRLVMQHLWETVFLSLAGGGIAVLIAGWGLSAINRWSHSNLEGNLAFWWVWGLDRTAFIAAGAFVAATIALLGGVVAGRASNTRFNIVLQDGGARSGARREGRVARALVATQVATVSVLMFFGVMSGIVAYRVANVDLGYDTRNLLSSSIVPPGDRYTTREKRGAFFQALYDGMAQRPQLDGVLLRSGLADISAAEGGLELGSARLTPPNAKPRAYVLGILGSLETLGIALREGRLLGSADGDGAAPAAVVSQAFAQRHWPGTSAVGQQIRLSGLGETTQWRAVVGVVEDVLLGNPLSRDRSAQAVYIPLRQTDAQGSVLLFRHRGDAAAAQWALHQSLADVDPVVPPADVATFEEMLAKTTLIAKSVAKLFAACFGFALLLAVSGTYGLMARSIGQRTREIGVRRALGATDRSIVQLLLGQGGRQLGVGALVALPAMLLVGAGFSHFFPIGLGVSAALGLLVTAAIVVVVLAATYVPTRQALAVTFRDALWRD